MTTPASSLNWFFESGLGRKVVTWEDGEYSFSQGDFWGKGLRLQWCKDHPTSRPCSSTRTLGLRHRWRSETRSDFVVEVRFT